MIRKFILGIFVISIIAGALFFFFDTNTEETTKPKSDEAMNTSQYDKNLDSNTLVIGDVNAEITIIEYADYKCPQCGDFHQNVGKKLREEYIDTGKAKIIFRPFPVFSQDGAKALVGSYCAQDQGKFVEYHDAVFDYMWINHFERRDFQKAIDTVLTDQVMKQILTDIDMDFDSYTNCIKSEKYEKAYLDDIDLASPDEIQGTPTFIINGQKIVGSQPYSIFKTLLDIGN